MHPAFQRLLRSRGVSLFLLISVLLVGSLTLTQCRMITDRMVGADLLHGTRAGDCLRDCQQAYWDAVLQENERFRKAILQCGRNASCISHEIARHLNILRDLWQQRVTCVNGCHHQGGGGDDR